MVTLRGRDFDRGIIAIEHGSCHKTTILGGFSVSVVSNIKDLLQSTMDHRTIKYQHICKSELFKSQSTNGTQGFPFDPGGG